MCLRPSIESKMIPKWLQNGSQIAPKWLPEWLPNASRIDPEASWRALGVVLAAWRPLGGLSESSWRPPGPNQSALNSLLGAPRRVPRQLSASIGAKELPKWGPKWVQNGVRKRLRLKMLKTRNSCTVHRISMIFLVPGAHYGSKMGSKKGSETGSRRRRLWKASWKPLGAL